MLKTRVITAVLIAAVVLSLLFGASPPVFATASALVLLGVGGWEAGRLGGLRAAASCWLFGAALFLLGSGIGLSAGLISSEIPGLSGLALSVPQLLVGPALLWLVLLCWLALPGFGRAQTPVWCSVKLLVLSIILISAWLALSWLHQRSPWLVLMLIIIIASADVGAYFTGRKFGGPKLAPRISPGKTWSGVAGGLFATVAVTTLFALALPYSPFPPLLAGAIAFILAWISIGGDLLMSLLKRQRGLKDSSQLLPGHGGILDRVDSLGAALPFFALAVAHLAN